jgi:hypothetical protein
MATTFAESLLPLLLRKPIVGIAGCCARAARGQQAEDAAAAPPSSEMNSRRLMCRPQCEDYTLPHHYKNAALCTAAKLIVEWQRWVIRDRSIRHPLPPHVRFAPKADN